MESASKELSIIFKFLRYSATFPFDSQFEFCKQKWLYSTFIHILLSVVLVVHCFLYPRLGIYSYLQEGKFLEFLINKVEFVGGTFMGIQMVGWFWVKRNSMKKIRGLLGALATVSDGNKNYGLNTLGKLFVGTTAFLLLDWVFWSSYLLVKVWDFRDAMLFFSNFLFVLSLTGQFLGLLDVVERHLKPHPDPPAALARYERLSEAVEVLREVYEPQILVLFSWNFSLLLCTFYVILDPRRNVDVIGYSNYVLYLISPLILIIGGCSYYLNKVSMFHHQLHCEMLNTENGELMRNDTLIFHFTTVKEMSFSACGFFNLDNALICSMTATGTTYLVILLQYTKDSSDTK